MIFRRCEARDRGDRSRDREHGGSGRRRRTTRVFLRDHCVHARCIGADEFRFGEPDARRIGEGLVRAFHIQGARVGFCDLDAAAGWTADRWREDYRIDGVDEVKRIFERCGVTP